jgi:uncharacterized membrane protein
MTETSERSTPKSRIESLSDLIFGLALSIGALTLIGQAPKDFQGLLSSIAYFGFSFLILISVWYSYTQTISNLRVETSRAVYLNIFLLFLVSIEPFLFNQLVSPNISVQYTSILYALDLGGLFTILALFVNSILAEKNRPAHFLRHYTFVRNAQVLGAVLFFVSALPVFWTWTIPINSSTGIPLRFIFWIVPLFLRYIRRLWERKK